MQRALLTIDDAPSRNTPAIVDYLNEIHIPAILFIVGKNAERFRAEALYAIRKGMVLGNHSYSHPGFSALSPEACIAEIEKCEAMLDSLYQAAGVPRLFRPFRFPYGDKGGENKALLQAYLAKNGFHKVDDTFISYPWWAENRLNTDIDTFWTFDFEEYRLWQDPAFTTASIQAKMAEQTPPLGAPLYSEKSGHIILMHAFDETEACLPGYWQKLLSPLLKKGIRFEAPRFR